MEKLFLMLQRKNNKQLIALGAFGALIFLVSHAEAGPIKGKSGEVIAIPASQEERTDQFLIKQGSQTLQLISLPFVKSDLLITRHSKDVLVKQVNFGESRITISDTSKVNLSQEDQMRANAEAVQIKNALSASTKNITPSFKFLSPVPGVVTSPFGKQRFINGLPRSAHLALDLAGAEGTPITSPLKGIVVLVGDFFYTGHTVILDHGHGLFSSYAHMSETKVAVGDVIEQSALVGLVGSTGRVTGPHLHWTVYFDGNKINPESLIKKDFLASLLQRSISEG